MRSFLPPLPPLPLARSTHSSTSATSTTLLNSSSIRMQLASPDFCTQAPRIREINCSGSFSVSTEGNPTRRKGFVGMRYLSHRRTYALATVT